MKKLRIAGLLLAVCCAFSQTAGCQIGNTRIKLETMELNGYRNVFKINDYKCSIKFAKLYLCNYRNLYGNVYGMDLWKDGDTKSLETYVKDITIQQLSRIVCMDLLAREKGMELSEEEKKKVQAAAEEYYDSLNETERSFMDVKKKDIEEAYDAYALADKLYDSLTNGVNEEISDDEARVIRVQQIYVSDLSTAKTVRKKLKAGEDFTSVAEDYNRAGEAERTVARGEYPAEVEEIAFNLDNDACSGMIETEDGYYFVKCLSKFEEKQTEENKKVIRIKREREQFENSYESFVREADFRMNERLWSEVSLKDTEGITTNSFFGTYDKYFGKTAEEK